jgi:pyruvate,orthophosphate dikinase
LGDEEDPLLVSVRSGAPVSMPGMMDTVLNLGLSDAACAGLARRTGDRRFALDCYRRFIHMFGEVVLDVDRDLFEREIDALKRARGVEADADLCAADLEGLVRTYKGLVEEETGSPFPEEPQEQLERAVRAVFDSWNNDRAIAYRKEHGIPGSLGTAVTVQRMVFGNSGARSATGVAFTRDPSTGARGIFGEFLVNAQGEDVVAGVRTPRPLAEMREVLPRAYDEFMEAANLLEREQRDMQDVEFTVEDDELYLLQTRGGKRTAAAAVKIAREMAEEGLISEEEALLRVEPKQLDQLLHPRLDPSAQIDILCKGLGASPGAATGTIVLTPEEAEEAAGRGQNVVLVRRETSPDDVKGMIAARGVLTALGGMTSHAAVVARGMGKPAVTGCSALRVDPERREVEIAGKRFAAGDVITIEGSYGIVAAGRVPLVEPEINEDLEELLRWADGLRVLGVRANADTPEDAKKAHELGAEGIGLCRTEHMFMEDGRLPVMRRMILAEDDAALGEALAQLEPLQRGDFEGIFSTMSGLPVTVRLLDPPLHEFLPDKEELVARLAELHGQDGEVRQARALRRELGVVESLEEANPMLGLRGVRLGVLREEVYRMQVRAVAGAIRQAKEAGGEPVVEIMVPLVGFSTELERVRALIEEELGEALGDDREAVAIGTMIELPRACAAAARIAARADFFSFGTNDLTQMACGMSRDDAEEKFLAEYLGLGIIEENPFERIDTEGVGEFVRMAVARGREANQELKLGVCGEHGGDAQSIRFFHEVGLDYVSCSPFRVPVARLAAAQAVLGGGLQQVKPTPTDGGRRQETGPFAAEGGMARGGSFAAS